jgi:hypothetical protein
MNARKEPQVLEAVTAIARIATLAFYPDGTKIAFRNHNIVICPPTKTDIIYHLMPQKLMQGIDRYWNSDSRDDLHIFNHVIKNFIDLYIIPYKKKNMQTYNNLINLTKYACVGLIKLQRTYSEQHCNAVLVIQLYINILRDLIRGKHDETSFYVPYGQAAKPIVGDGDDVEQDHYFTLSTIFDIEKIKTFWSQRELDKLCEQFNGCFKNQGEVDDVIFSNNPTHADMSKINSVINVQDTESSLMDQDPLIDMSDGPDEADKSDKTDKADTKSDKSDKSDEFVLPKPSNQSLPIVKGLVVSISEILDAMDQRFSLVLTQSIQGIIK